MHCTFKLLVKSLHTAEEPYWEVYNTKPIRYISSVSHNPGKSEVLKLISVSEFIRKKNSSLTLKKRE